MPLPQALARANRYVTNPIARRLAGRVPPFAIVEHTGRRSGKVYRTPVMVFRKGDTFAIALTYGPGTEWVRNVQAARGCVLEYRGRRIPLSDPRLVSLADVRQIPAAIRLVLWTIDAEWVLVIQQSG